MNEREIVQFSPDHNNSTPMVSFATAEPPVIARNQRESSSGYTDTNCSSITTNAVVDRQSAHIMEQTNRQSPMKASLRGSTVSNSSDPMGHIYIESARSYQREPDGAGSRYVPRTAGRS